MDMEDGNRGSKGLVNYYTNISVSECIFNNLPIFYFDTFQGFVDPSNTKSSSNLHSTSNINILFDHSSKLLICKIQPPTKGSNNKP